MDKTISPFIFVSNNKTYGAKGYNTHVLKSFTWTPSHNKVKVTTYHNVHHTYIVLK